MDTREVDVSVLLGAGASMDGGIPTSSQLVEKVGDRLTDPRLHAIFDAVHAGCLMRSASARIAGGSPAWPTIEDIANTIDALIDRNMSDIAPFVASWSPMLKYMDDAEDVSRATSQRVARLLQEKFAEASIGVTDTTNENWSEWATHLVEAIRPHSSTDALLRKLKNRLPHIVAELLAMPTDGDFEYLGDLFRLAPEKADRLCIATLNYDLVVEAVCDSRGISYTDGLDEWGKGIPATFKGSKIALYKLHGSLSWQRDNDDHYRRSIVTVDAAEPGIIFGGKNKLTTRGPYLDMLWQWRSELASKRKLVIIGYSFADEHVNGLLVQWARTGGAKRLIVVSRSKTWHGTSTGQWLLSHASRTSSFDLQHVAGPARTGTGQSIAEAMETLAP
ncbi:MAG: hypothetical protein CME34_19530 [Gordonia sp.]|uniref:SIR2 family protein n=1 Tax=Gordonia sp. (in: high G+C Gram-positive bacteria) TaxID=84139 RepID=UPI000C441BC2|nr:SIR2 family protein [Gordonia sp. (in: high G+C Gram-positive bacteria)]MAU84016.1 hypothetical protein [Gordonia sp. (in: high G+C Gram-positive bacteria)]